MWSDKEALHGKRSKKRAALTKASLFAFFKRAFPKQEHHLLSRCHSLADLFLLIMQHYDFSGLCQEHGKMVCLLYTSPSPRD